MKVILANDYRNIIGGTEVYMYSLKDGLEKQGHVVKVYGSNLNTKEYIKSQQIKSFNRYFKKLFNLQVYNEFKKLVQEFKPDIIHLNNIYNELSPSIILASGSVPIVLTVHDSMLVNAVGNLSERTGKPCKTRTCTGCMNCIGWKGMLYEKVRQLVYRLILKKVKLFITPSMYMKDFMLEAGLKPVQALPNGIDLLKYSKITNYNNLLYIGRLSREKGIEYLLKAMPKIIERVPEVQLNIVGNGPDKKYFETLVSDLNLNNKITFEDKVDRDSTYKFYKDSAVVVVPSIFPDNFPTVCIESLAVGRPVIGTNVGGIPELIFDGVNGFLISEKNYQMITVKVLELLSNINLINAMSKRANSMSKKYSIEKHVSQLELLYNHYLINKV